MPAQQITVSMNSFGTLFRVTILGESHGIGIGVVIDGCPAGVDFAEEDMQPDLARRRSGAQGTTPRVEEDWPRIVSGTFNGKTTGAPVTILFENANTRSRDYAALRQTPRPGHADFTASVKYGGYEDYRGGGHFSGRITLGLVAAGSLARKLIAPIEVTASLLEIGGSTDFDAAIEEALAAEDSIGGLIECRATHMPVGLGEPFFDSVESVISHLVFAIPATRGIEFGAGFAAARMRGSEHNDPFISAEGATATNNAGGINGGITNGNDLVFRVPIKPTSSIHKAQRTLNFATGQMVDLQIEGRHDTCIALRIPVIIESAAALALADLLLRAKGLAHW